MSCYLRYMKDILEDAGIELEGKEDRKKVDKAIHELVGVEYKNCSKTWKLVKEKKRDDGAFKSQLGSVIREAVHE